MNSTVSAKDGKRMSKSGNVLSVSTNDFYYFEWDLLRKVRYVRSFDTVGGIEVSVKHWYRFSKEELSELASFISVTIHLNGFESSDVGWMEETMRTVPNLLHFVVHPDTCDFGAVPERLFPKLSFENMDARKSSFKTVSEMSRLFARHQDARFTLDVNHAEENGIRYEDFLVVKRPSQIHLSAVNWYEKWRNFYEKLLPGITTPHAMCSLDAGFRFDPSLFKDTVVTLEWLFVPGREDLVKDEVAYAGELLGIGK